MTRLWAQEMEFGELSVTMLGEPTMVMDSEGLWWVDSWIEGGSLIEGPQVIKREGVYYLFFASGRYCEEDYAEGVGRSQSCAFETVCWCLFCALFADVLLTWVPLTVQDLRAVRKGADAFALECDRRLFPRAGGWGGAGKADRAWARLVRGRLERRVVGCVPCEPRQQLQPVWVRGPDGLGQRRLAPH